MAIDRTAAGSIGGVGRKAGQATVKNRRPKEEQRQAAEIAGAASAEAAYLAVHEDEPPLAPGADLTAAAFFDVDNTMMQGASIFHFARGLVSRDFFTTGDLLNFALAAGQVQDRG